jgi:cytochrome c553
MESWEHVLWSSCPAFPYSLLPLAAEYILSDFRIVVRRRGRVLQELALDDVAGVRLTRSWHGWLTASITVRIDSRRHSSAVVLYGMRQGAHLALLLQILSVVGALAPCPPKLLRPRLGLLAAATLAFALTFAVIAVARHSSLAPISYAADDPIAPRGRRRSPPEIAAFMEKEVMPFARRVLAPIKGGAANVTCESCHGGDAVRRRWQMPGVRALPEPELRLAGMERVGFWIEPQIRNAVYGYLAGEDKQSTAGYMRAVVMPGMAKLMHRPAYDFTKSYGYNRAHAAVGCYHCHLVESP